LACEGWEFGGVRVRVPPCGLSTSTSMREGRRGAARRSLAPPRRNQPLVGRVSSRAVEESQVSSFGLQT
jgi:hypothetical protein